MSKQSDDGQEQLSANLFEGAAQPSQAQMRQARLQGKRGLKAALTQAA